MPIYFRDLCSQSIPLSHRWPARILASCQHLLTPFYGRASNISRNMRDSFALYVSRTWNRHGLFKYGCWHADATYLFVQQVSGIDCPGSSRDILAMNPGFATQSSRGKQIRSWALTQVCKRRRPSEWIAGCIAHFAWMELGLGLPATMGGSAPSLSESCPKS